MALGFGASRSRRVLIRTSVWSAVEQPGAVDLELDVRAPHHVQLAGGEDVRAVLVRAAPSTRLSCEDEQTRTP